METPMTLDFCDFALEFPRSCALNALQTKSMENSTDPNATNEMEPQNESNLGLKR
jgi:hypothetical protein